VQTRKLALACPVCHSGEVYYSCTPNCCFNHVCAECGTTFEPATTIAGGTASGVIAPDTAAEAGEPTVACARCESTDVYMVDEASLVCGKCGTLLKLEITEVSPG